LAWHLVGKVDTDAKIKPIYHQALVCRGSRVAATGSGKTSLLRHFMGSNPKTDRFPSTSTARTTTSDIEVIIARQDTTFKAVVTFHSQWETTTSVAECVANACLATLYELPDEKIADKLLHHRDQVFRLNYVLGSFASADNANDEWTYEGEADTERVAEEAAELPVPPAHARVAH
jgi:hypothetical protein